MRKYVSEKASQISKSQTLAISAQAKKMREEGMSIIGFTAGEPDCNTPEYIIDAAKAALDAGKTKYTPSAGTEALRKAIAKKLLEENGLEYSFKNIVVSNGGKHALFNALYAIINDGDEVII
ncbi:MAG: aminotransferase class I/II-fold pyridoxal phosphate-dependent enzyme, partial [Clostridia bacterium]|nr:aminotransferase class I/II-fold pyridoxal phosphate-dependent enzyme [Clostridia bacterium]